MASGTNTESSIHVKSFHLEPSSNGSFEFAEIYCGFQLGKASGADVCIRKISANNEFRVDARGTITQLNRVKEILDELKEKSLKCSQNGYLSLGDNPVICFEGSQREEKDQLEFKKYVGPCQYKHEQVRKYIPRLLDLTGTSTGADRASFQSKFLSKWQVVKDEYSDIFHGELCLVLTFGTVYFMDITKTTLSILEFNDHLKSFLVEFDDALFKSAQRLPTSRVPYSFSFIPICSPSRSFQEFLEKTFEKENTEKKVKVRIGQLGMFDLDENLDFLQLNMESIRWFNGHVICKTEHDSPINELSVKCKLQSYRNLNLKAFRDIPEYSHLQGQEKICEKDGDGFIVNNEEVKFIREKETEVYSAAKIYTKREINRPIRVEVSQISEYEVGSQNMRCLKRPDRLEVAVIPSLPDLNASEEEMKCYVNDLWDIALFFGNMLNA